MEIRAAIQKPRKVKVVQVTEENLDEVVKWCNGVKDISEEGAPFVRVNYDKDKPNTFGRMHRAYIGDWVIRVGARNFRVYLDGAFKKNFKF